MDGERCPCCGREVASFLYLRGGEVVVPSSGLLHLPPAAQPLVTLTREAYGASASSQAPFTQGRLWGCVDSMVLIIHWVWQNVKKNFLQKVLTKGTVRVIIVTDREANERRFFFRTNDTKCLEFTERSYKSWQKSVCFR